MFFGRDICFYLNLQFENFCSEIFKDWKDIAPNIFADILISLNAKVAII